MRNSIIIISTLLALSACSERVANAMIGFSQGVNAYPVYSAPLPKMPYGIPVYSPKQCTGPVIAGQCQGGTIGLPIAKCYGTMLNGKCIGTLAP